MKSRRRNAALLLALLAIGGLAACGDDDDTTEGTTATSSETTEAAAGGDATGETEPAAPVVPTIVVRDGAPVGGAEELEFNAGDQIRFNVKSNEADEVHVHGYDIEQEVGAGGTAKLSFPADLEGIYEVELHHSGELIAELRVNP
jgi:hypothetical protein